MPEKKEGEERATQDEVRCSAAPWIMDYARGPCQVPSSPTPYQVHPFTRCGDTGLLPGGVSPSGLMGTIPVVPVGVRNLYNAPVGTRNQNHHQHHHRITISSVQCPIYQSNIRDSIHSHLAHHPLQSTTLKNKTPTTTTNFILLQWVAADITEPITS